MTSRAFFVTQTNRLDVSSAVEHGEPVFLLDRSPSPYKIDECVEAIEIALEEANYDPMYDLIAIAGPQILTALLVAIAAARGATRVLLWDLPGERYVERSLTLHNNNNKRKVS